MNDFADGFDDVVELGFGDGERRRDFQDHEVVAADLGEDVLVLEESHDEDLSEEAGVDGFECFVGDAGGEFARWLEFDAGKHSFATDFFDHLEVSECGAQPVAEFDAHAVSALDEVLVIEDLNCGKPRAHCQRVLAERGGVDEGAAEGVEDGFVDGVGHEDSGTGNEASAESLGHDDHVWFYSVALRGKEAAGASHAGLYLVEDEKRVVLAAEFLDCG